MRCVLSVSLSGAPGAARGWFRLNRVEMKSIGLYVLLAAGGVHRGGRGVSDVRGIRIQFMVSASPVVIE